MRDHGARKLCGVFAGWFLIIVGAVTNWYIESTVMLFVIIIRTTYDSVRMRDSYIYSIYIYIL